MKLLLSAGEVSGDQHGAALLAALARRVPELHVSGIAGDRCEAAGMRLLAHQRDLAVTGLVEALSKVRFARALMKRLTAEAVDSRVDGAILIDSPDFNLPFAKLLSRAGIPVVFYVSPQVWAWRSGRAKKIHARGRAVLVLFGFEKRWWDARGLGDKVTWVGHPLVEKAQAELAVPDPGPAPGRRRVVLMPGSRRNEIERNLPVMAEALSILKRERTDVDAVLIRADSVPEELLRTAGGAGLTNVPFVSGAHLALLAASDVLVVASGTATIEGLLTRLPMVVLYRMNGLTHFLARLLVRGVDRIAMANIVSDDGSGALTVPELIQNDASPERIAKEVARFLDDPALVARTKASLDRGLADLGGPGAPDRTAEAVLAALARPERA
ncbi:MAG: lipid-A-disaccharide synthase [Acidobacteria bacterium]|nr:lipid-A-disaccharide synthase [Acidobacteriota bacterium]